MGYQLLERRTLKPLPLLVLEYWPPFGLDLDLHQECQPYKTEKQTNEPAFKNMNFCLLKKHMDFRSQDVFKHFVNKLVHDETFENNLFELFEDYFRWLFDHGGSTYLSCKNKFVFQN